MHFQQSAVAGTAPGIRSHFQQAAVAATPRRTMGLAGVVARWLRIVEKMATVRWLQVVFNVSGMLLQQYPKTLRDRVTAIARGVAAPPRGP